MPEVDAAVFRVPVSSCIGLITGHRQCWCPVALEQFRQQANYRTTNCLLGRLRANTILAAHGPIHGPAAGTRYIQAFTTSQSTPLLSLSRQGLPACAWTSERCTDTGRGLQQHRAQPWHAEHRDCRWAALQTRLTAGTRTAGTLQQQLMARRLGERLGTSWTGPAARPCSYTGAAACPCRLGWSTACTRTSAARPFWTWTAH